MRASTTSGPLLLARCGEFALAFPLSTVREVIAGPPLGPPDPRCHGWRGALAHRGDSVPLVDLRERLGAPSATEPARAIVVEFGPGRIALAVDAVAGIATAEGRAEPAMTPLPGLSAVVRVGAGLVAVLDPERLFQPDERSALDGAERAGGPA